MIEKVAGVIWKPASLVIDTLCIDCSLGSEHENLFMLTFFGALCFIAYFSLIITNVINRWVALTHNEENEAMLGYLGVVLVALGAEIPDCIQSTTAAIRGHGAMAVASCLGSQTLNICVGLGLPWLIVNLLS